MARGFITRTPVRCMARDVGNTAPITVQPPGRALQAGAETQRPKGSEPVTGSRGSATATDQSTGSRCSALRGALLFLHSRIRCRISTLFKHHAQRFDFRNLTALAFAAL